jgi:glutathione S-transferase
VQVYAAFSTSRLVATIPAIMGIDLYWGSGSPYSWRVLLALEYKRIPYTSHLLQFSRQEHKSPQMLAMNFRGRVPVLRDGDYVVFESLAVLYYLDEKYPDPPLFGRTPEEAGVIMRVICEYQAYTEDHLMKIARAYFLRPHAVKREELEESVHVVASEARSIEGRLSKSDWVVGDTLTAADIVIFPGLQVLLRALRKPQANDVSSRFLPLEVNYPALARWIKRVESMSGYERTYPPHWRSGN